MLLLFALPLSLEIHEVMRLWLKTPPMFSAEIALAMLIVMVLGNLCDGYWMAVMGLGRGVWLYNFCVGWSGFIKFALAWILFFWGFRMWGLWIAIVSGSLCTLVMRLWLGRKLLGYSIRYWARSVLLPVAALVVLSSVAGLPVRMVMAPSFARVMATTLCSVSVLMASAWFVVLTAEEKAKVTAKLKSIAGKFRRTG